MPKFLARVVNNRNKPAPTGHPKWGGKPVGYKPPDNWYTVPRAWQGETCFIVAGGPSLEGFVMPDLQGIARVIAINSSYQIAPYGDVLYWTDRPWWLAHYRNVIAQFGGFCVGMNQPGTHGSKAIRDCGQIGLSVDPTGVCRGNDGGYGAINLAFLFGAKRICLLGYDMGSSPNGKTHWHEGHAWNPETAAQMDQKCEKGFLPLYPYLKEPLERAGVQVFNCTPGSRLTQWPYISFHRALQAVRSEVAQRATQTNYMSLSAAMDY